MDKKNGHAVSAIDALQAVLLITKHLDDLLPFLMALRRVPAELPQRVGLIPVAIVRACLMVCPSLVYTLDVCCAALSICCMLRTT
jgi:hypothetical protein